MKLGILGATGPTGIETVKLALKQGYEVIAIVRNVEKIPQESRNNKNFSYRNADIFNTESLVKALDGVEIVVSCLGYVGLSWPYTTMTFYLESCKCIVEAMKRLQICRFVMITMRCTVYDPSHPFFLEWFFKPLLIGRHAADMFRMEQYLGTEKDSIDFTVLKPGGLTNGPQSGKNLLSEEGQMVRDPRAIGRMSRADLALFVIKALVEKEWIGKCMAVAVEK